MAWDFYARHPPRARTRYIVIVVASGVANMGTTTPPSLGFPRFVSHSHLNRLLRLVSMQLDVLIRAVLSDQEDVSGEHASDFARSRLPIFLVSTSVTTCVSFRQCCRR